MDSDLHMLYRLFYLFHTSIPGISVLQYVTFRAVVAAAMSMLLSIVFGPITIYTLTRLRMNQPILDVGPESHRIKSGTPTMGGSLIVFAIVVSTLSWCDLTSPSVWVALISLIGFGIVGACDDIKKLILKQNLGLTSWQKMFLLTIISLLVAFFILHFNLRGINTSQLSVPFFKKFTPQLGIFLVPWIWLVMVGTSNAVNLTDGLDGLAIGGTTIVAITFAILAYVAGHAKIANYLMVPNVPDGGELAVFMAAMSGASIGFLWFNAYPAEVFMGDTGSLALGGALGTVAVMIKQELLLIIAGGLFVIEAVSVILQVGSFKLRGGKRIFRMAPFHHHLELGGLKETKVVIRLWITAIVCCALALSSLKLR
jgi:phospho-N-acetylmuramoyl-pentapeptide-transferase